uniref:Uncharacterized protein n=1 Tax=Romanomermis culicivorax TaxID=13658 RepID=A0A915ID27_ROMCU
MKNNFINITIPINTIQTMSNIKTSPGFLSRRPEEVSLSSAEKFEKLSENKEFDVSQTKIVTQNRRSRRRNVPRNDNTARGIFQLKKPKLPITLQKYSASFQVSLGTQEDAYANNKPSLYAVALKLAVA